MTPRLPPRDLLVARVESELPPGIPVIRPVTGPIGDFAGAAESVARIGDVVLTGLGEDAESAGAWGASAVLTSKLAGMDLRGLPGEVAARITAGACLRAWLRPRYQTIPYEDAPRLERIAVLSDSADYDDAWLRVSAGVAGATIARDLVSEPANMLTPAAFVARLTEILGATHEVYGHVDERLTMQVLGPDVLRERGFGGLLAVGQGSAHPPCLVVLRWAGEGAPVAFVGKGITFDTGGISIKPADRMWEMRADMAGAAACAGAMLALARRGSPAAAIAVLALAENATGAASYRPGDVLRMFDGSTVAVVDTDAEGRLVLADALAYAVTQKPRAIIDLATLTGSIVVALGHHMAGAFGTDAALLAAAQAAGAAVGEPIWPMPLAEAHRRALDSDIADIRHCVDGSGHPDSCQAAAFLRCFVGDVAWLHLDIAGVESREEASERHAAGPTGFGVRLLDRLVTTHFERHG